MEAEHTQRPDALTNGATNYTGLRHFCAALMGGRLSGIRAINLAGTNLQEEGGVMVVEALMGLPLETLDFYSGGQGNHLKEKTAAALGCLLAKTKTLTRLNYGYNSLSAGKGQAANSFAKGLAANQTLTSLDITHTDFGIKTWAMMADALKAPPLTDLNVSGCGLRGAGAGATLADLLSHVKLRNLDCLYMEAPTEEAELAAAAVIANTERCCGVPVADMRLGNLTALNARGVGQLGVLMVAQLLPLQNGLTTLILRDNSLKDDFLKVFAPFEKLKALTHLDLASTQMHGKGCQVLAELLPKTQITALVLNGNTKLSDKEGTEGILALAAVLPATKLVKLSVKLGGFSDGLAEASNVALIKAAKIHGMESMNGDDSAGNPGAESAVSVASMEKYPRGLYLD
jgi:Ran GTPase-activating protein (RanGAP) involved in mRNA processing and transport